MVNRPDPANLRPLLAITLGDPAGIGPEVIVRAWDDPEVHQRCRPVVLGHPEILKRAVKVAGSSAQVETVDSTAALGQLGIDRGNRKHIVCVPVGEDDLLNAPPGQNDPRSGEAAYQAVVRAIRGALAGEFDG
ncbi:4-hydroxythreonine-4-phosphate dehydrogenase PdxA, partial [Pirellulales bacterium]|nr:4-hydroxythreonine-4-phosphate dehydrogenase PdxA [Pirellulales bacterium]